MGKSLHLSYANEAKFAAIWSNLWSEEVSQNFLDDERIVKKA